MTDNRWISVEERLPEDGVDVLIYDRENLEAPISSASHRSGRGWVCDLELYFDGPTHWMPLPEPPE